MVNLIGIVINVIIPLVVMCHVPNDALKTQQQSYSFIRILLGSWIIAALTTTRSKTTYCIFVVPTYIVSFMVLPMILQPPVNSDTVVSSSSSTTMWESKEQMIAMIRILWYTALLASWKINICMSVCMHRYASHAAFKCGPTMNIVLCILGCLANQGGPLWWASQHRCHHKLRSIVFWWILITFFLDMMISQKSSFNFPPWVPPPKNRFCELPRDPHSPKQVGTERAFGFFLERIRVEEEFVPQHIQFPGLRLLDTWSFLVVSLELWCAYTFLGGNIALFIAFTSGWMSQTISLWFNIANHPIVKTSIPINDKNTTTTTSKKLLSQCTASDDQAPIEPGIWYVPFYLLDAVVPLYSWLAMEDQHEHHHNHGNLAKRSTYDIAYWTFIQPLEMLGLVRNVVVS